MKAYVVISIARQIQGEFVFITTDKGFTDRALAEIYLRGKGMNWKETIQGIECVCEKGIHEVDID